MIDEFELVVIGLLAVLLLASGIFIRRGAPTGALREVGLAILGGVVVGVAVLGLQVAVEDELNDLAQSASQQTDLARQQNSLTVREMASDNPMVEAESDALADQDLSSLDLSSIDLSGQDLDRTDLSETELERADLTDAILTDAVLTDADLSGADLTGADLTGADLTGADLTGATCPDGFVTDSTCDGHLGS